MARASVVHANLLTPARSRALAICGVILLVQGVATRTALAQDIAEPRERVVRLDPLASPPGADVEISGINLRSADLRDVFRAISDASGLNVIVDDRIDTRATVSLEGITALDAVLFLTEEYGLSVVQTGAVLRVRPPPPIVPPPPSVSVQAGRLTADLDGVPLSDLVRRLAEVSGVNVIPEAGVVGPVSGYVTDVPLEEGLGALLRSNGFQLRNRGGDVYSVEYGLARAVPPDEGGGEGIYVESDSLGRFDLDLRNASVRRVLREIARRSQVGVVTYSVPEGTVADLSATGLTLEGALEAVLRGTGASFRRQGDAYVVGLPDQDGIVATRLIQLGYVGVEGVVDLVPDLLRQGVTLQEVTNQNAILVTGPNDRIEAVEAFLEELDRPAAQVLIEALVVDVLDSDVSELGVTFGRGLIGTDTSGTRLPTGFVLNGINTGEGEGVFYGDGAVSDVLQGAAELVGIRNIGRLPADFYLRIRALEQQGKVEVRSRPQIATLNGTPASLSIGTTQYFILRRTTPIGVGADAIITQEDERFEQIDANVTLEVLPFVGAEGEVTVRVVPEFSQPIGELQVGTPPTISTRRIESTVRLHDGETIILGGLIEDRDIITDNKVPILGDIPLLGRLFRSRVRSRRKSELVIYLTPHVFYGGEDEAARWRRLARDLEDGPLSESDPQAAPEPDSRVPRRDSETGTDGREPERAPRTP